MVKAKYFPEWEKMTVREIRSYLEERSSVILPLGVTEQHGYHLPTCTDGLIASGVALRVGKRIGMLVAPTINMAFSGGQLPGTINVNPNIVGLLVGEVLRSLVAQGFRNIFLLPGHGGSENFRGMDNSLKMLLRDDPAFEKVMLVMAPVWKLSPLWQGAFQEKDWHSGHIETSAVLALAPHLVQLENVQTDEPRLLAEMREHPDNYQYARKPIENGFVVPRMAQRPEIKVGVMGDPSKASAELGERMIADTVEAASRLFTDLEKNRSPEYRKAAWTPEPIVL
jgi:creatinine amidohydrolase